MHMKRLHPLHQPPRWIWGLKSRICRRWSINCRKSVGEGSPERPWSVPHVAEDTIPPMPTLVPRELSEWMEDRQSDMQEAMSCGNLKKLLELTSLQGQVAERHAEMTGGMAP